VNPLEDAIDAVRRSELVVVPTDTVYGVGTRPDRAEATARLFDVKGRPRALELPVLTASRLHAEDIAVFDDRALRLAGAFWPGALTLVLPRADESRGWDLGGDPETVGVRVPHHPLALALLAATGPLAVTSANLSGRPPLATCDELFSVFGRGVAVYLCEDAPLEGVASTVVDLTGPDLHIIREGSIDREALGRALVVR
jgi:L-threonylcarbamoyladenylate synthase